MTDQQAIFSDLRTSIADALRRSEERMSHVQRQLAGWSDPAALEPLPQDDSGWNTLQEQTESLTAGVDQELEAVHTSLAELVQAARKLK